MTEKQSLHMVIPAALLSAFHPLLQRGFWLQVETGCSVASLLTEQFGIETDYIVERLTTIFLDFKPIDDMETTYIKDGSILALCSAQPGLVGTTLRRGSHLAAMRGDISCQNQQPETRGPGRIKIKLFNMIMAELGAIFLAYGVFLTNGEMNDLLSEMDDDSWQSVRAVNLGGQLISSVDLKQYIRLALASDELAVTVKFKE